MAESAAVFVHHSTGGATGMQWVEVMGAVQNPAMYSTAPQASTTHPKTPRMLQVRTLRCKFHYQLSFRGFITHSVINLMKTLSGDLKIYIWNPISPPFLPSSTSCLGSIHVGSKPDAEVRSSKVFNGLRSNLTSMHTLSEWLMLNVDENNQEKRERRRTL